MTIIDKKWNYGTYKAYADVPQELLDFTPGCRVQPAPFAGKPISFYLINRYEPGENRFFPNGGFDLRGENSVRYAFDLDQVVLFEDKKVKVKSSKPVAKKAVRTKEVSKKSVCGQIKKDGKPCQMKTDGTACRFHKK